MSAPRCLVTGASGFIGSHLVPALAAAGYTVDAVSRVDRPPRVDCRWHRADLTSREQVASLLAETRPDVVVHLAGEVTGRRDVDAVAPTFAANLGATVHLLEASVRHRVERIVLVGSLEEPDDQDARATPVSPYAAAKWASCMYGRMFHALYDAPVVIARVFMVYGPGQPDETKLVPYVCRSLLLGKPPQLASGDRPVDWIYVDDVVSGLVAAVVSDGLEGLTVELGSGHLVTVREVVERLHGLLGGPSPRFGAVPDRPNERVRAARHGLVEQGAGWAPRVGLDEGLRRTARWYGEAHGDHPRGA